MALPGLVIGGAPKCGTTSLFEWLADHPAVAPSRRKETFYLVDRESPFLDPDSNYHAHGLAGYESWFPEPPPGGLALEATTHYLYQRTAREVLATLATAPLALFVLRQPAARVYSSFRFARDTLLRVDRSLSFADFVRLCRERPGALAGRISDPRTAYVLARDLDYSRYAEHLAPWLEALGRERVEVVLFEELRRRPERVVGRLAARLGLDRGFYDGYSFAPRNPTVRIRWPRLHRLVRRLARRAPKPAALRRLYGSYLDLQDAPAAAGDAADREALAELEEDYRPLNERLAAELGLEISPWK